MMPQQPMSGRQMALTRPIAKTNFAKKTILQKTILNEMRVA
jgi:hypothetical protein